MCLRSTWGEALSFVPYAIQCYAIPMSPQCFMLTPTARSPTLAWSNSTVFVPLSLVLPSPVPLPFYTLQLPLHLALCLHAAAPTAASCLARLLSKTKRDQAGDTSGLGRVFAGALVAVRGWARGKSAGLAVPVAVSSTLTISIAVAVTVVPAVGCFAVLAVRFVAAALRHQRRTTAGIRQGTFASGCAAMDGLQDAVAVVLIDALACVSFALSCIVVQAARRRGSRGVSPMVSAVPALTLSLCGGPLRRLEASRRRRRGHRVGRSSRSQAF